MQFGYPYLIRLSFFEIQSDPDPVLNCKIRLDRDPTTDHVQLWQSAELPKVHVFHLETQPCSPPALRLVSS